MEYVEGKPLQRLIPGRIAARAAAGVAIEFADAVAAAHDAASRIAT